MEAPNCPWAEREQKRAPAIEMMGQNRRGKAEKKPPSLNSGVEGGTAIGEANQAFESKSTNL